MLTIISGALAGAFHVIAGPDHLAAVAPIAADRGARGWMAGWTWGAGHASGVLVVAVAAVLARDLLPSVAALSAWGERLVGGALVAVGLWALGSGLRVQRVRHEHEGVSHQHLHVRSGPPWLRRLGHAHAAFCLGVLHGVAGTSHLVGVLPALALPTRGAGLLYLGSFGAGTVAAMTAFAAVSGVTGARIRRSTGTYRAVMATAGIVAIGVGGVWLTAPTL
jgi:hypothetical protein